MAPKEQLPDDAPFPIFFLPNFLGILLALCMERLNVENLLADLLHEDAHRFSLLGFSFFLIANVNSFLGGSVVLARIQYNVKLPNLYADPSDKDGVLFNCVQRGHQNFLEIYAQVVLSILFTALVADRPNVAALMLAMIGLGRVRYALGYKSNVSDRMSGQLLSIFTMSIGVGYGFLLGLTSLGIKLLAY